MNDIEVSPFDKANITDGKYSRTFVHPLGKGVVTRALQGSERPLGVMFDDGNQQEFHEIGESTIEARRKRDKEGSQGVPSAELAIDIASTRMRR